MHVQSRRAGRIAGLVVSVLLGAAALAGCGTGDDAVAQGGTFQFVSPGGKTVITYAAADRRPVAGMSGPDVVTDAPLSLSDARYAGKVVVVNVWGSWCGPCRGEADALETSYAETKSSGVEFLLTWNLRHIANAHIRPRLESVCKANGCEPPTICTPDELLGEQTDDFRSHS